MGVEGWSSSSSLSLGSSEGGGGSYLPRSPSLRPTRQTNGHRQQLVGHKLLSEKLQIGQFPEKNHMLVLAIPALFILPTEVFLQKKKKTPHYTQRLAVRRDRGTQNYAVIAKYDCIRVRAAA